MWGPITARKLVFVIDVSGSMGTTFKYVIITSPSRQHYYVITLNCAVLRLVVSAPVTAEWLWDWCQWIYDTNVALRHH